MYSTYIDVLLSLFSDMIFENVDDNKNLTISLLTLLRLYASETVREICDSVVQMVEGVGQ